MTLRNKELFWCIGSVILVLILNIFIFGIDAINANAALTLNVHDTSFIIANYHFVLLLSVFVFFTIYLVRTLHYNFKNVIANLVLMFSILLFILILTGIDSILNTLINQTTGWTIYPPLSATNNLPKIQPKANYLQIASQCLFFTQIVLLILLGYFGFKTGLHYKKNSVA